MAGARALLRGDLFYGNYWGGPVFGPLAIAIGAFCLYLAMLRWRKLVQRPERLKGRAARSSVIAAPGWRTSSQVATWSYRCPGWGLTGWGRGGR